MKYAIHIMQSRNKSPSHSSISPWVSARGTSPRTRPPPTPGSWQRSSRSPEEEEGPSRRPRWSCGRPSRGCPWESSSAWSSTSHTGGIQQAWNQISDRGREDMNGNVFQGYYFYITLTIPDIDLMLTLRPFMSLQFIFFDVAMVMMQFD